LVELGGDEMIILKWILKMCDGEAWTVLIWLSIGTSAGVCDWGYELSGSLKCGAFLE